MHGQAASQNSNPQPSKTPRISLQQSREMIPTSRRVQIFVASFLAVTSIHAIRTTYSFSKSYIPSEIQIVEEEIGLVDSIMLLFVGIGNLAIAIRPLQQPIRTLAIAFVLCGLEYALVPVSMSLLQGQSAFATLLVLMAINGYLQSFSWPNLLPLIHTVYSPDRNVLLLSFWTTGTNVGNILGFLLCQYFVLGLGLGWQVGMLIAAAYIVAIGVYMGVRIREMPKLGQQDQENSHHSQSEEAKSSKQQQVGSRTSIDLNSQQSQNVMKQSLISRSSMHSQPGNMPQKPFLSRAQSSPPSLSALQPQPSVLHVFSTSPRVTLLTISFALLKSVMYGILLWLPAYFYAIGLVEYSLYIPMTFDAASIVGSVLLGMVLKQLAPNRKNLALIPMLFLLLIFFIALKAVDFSVTGYFIVIALVGLCLGGSFNTMAGLVTMELVRTLPPWQQTKYLSFYSALLMAFANLVTSITQVIISYTVGHQDQGKLFGIFVVYTAINLFCLVAVAFIEEYTLRYLNKQTRPILQGYKPVQNKDPKYSQIQITQIK